jgi:uncharacterized protein
MPRVVHFEITADEPERATKFYRDVFGWEIQKWAGPEDYWLLKTGEGEPGIDGGLLRRTDNKPGMPYVVNTLQVSSVDEYAARVTAGGGEVVVPPFAIPGVGRLAYCRDTEGNVFGIMHDDPTAR